MTVTYGFYDSLNGDRKYNAKQISELFDGIIRDGVFRYIGDALAVSAGGGMSVIVGTGRAWFNHTWTYNDTPLILQVDQSEIALNRVDTVVLEVNSNVDVRANTIKIVKGVPSSEPVATELVRNEFVNQYPLAHIYVSAGATEITSADIENKIGSSDCPFVIGILVTPGDLLNLIEEHKADNANPHGVTKAQLGLGNVQNYGIATQAEAEAGTANNKYMTPLRTKQLIDSTIVYGSYVGNGAAVRTWNIGFTPRAVSVWAANGRQYSWTSGSDYFSGGFFAQGLPLRDGTYSTSDIILEIDTNGFKTTDGADARGINSSGVYYYYLAFR
jgi:hypothetical protein